MFHGHVIYCPKPRLGGRPNTKPGHQDTLNSHKLQYILFHQTCGPAWIEIHWNSIWLRTRSHMTSHYTWESVTTLHDFGGVIERPLNTFFWAQTISWSRLLARVWSDPKMHNMQFWAKRDLDPRQPLKICLSWACLHVLRSPGNSPLYATSSSSRSN